MLTQRSAFRGLLGRAIPVLAAVLACLLIAPAAASARPIRPSDGQIDAAQRDADSAAAQVATIAAQLSAAQASVTTAAGRANIALDAYEGKQQAYVTAQQDADRAVAAAQQAQVREDAARVAVAGFARDSYISGSTSSRSQALLTAGSPAQMLERAALLDAAGSNRSSVLDAMSAAEQQAAAASATAQDSLHTAATLKDQAAGALAAAERDEAAARQQAAAFQSQQAQLQAQLDQARQTLATLQGQRAAAIAYDQQQAAAASAPSGAWFDPSSAAGPGSPGTARAAIAAAMRWVGTTYAWGGGSLTGPSLGWGIDYGVVGFDCSGLTRYAYAQAGVTIPRQSTQQYAALPKVASSNLQPGDLLFYAFDTSDPSTIHHVTMYLGGGQMIEAPESGERVHVTGVRWGGYLGAVRPTG